MTSSLFSFILPNLVFTAGILAVLVLRKPVRIQFGARMAYALWLLPVLALAASFLPPRVVDMVQSMPVFESMPSGPEYVLPAAPIEAMPAAPVFAAPAKSTFDPLLAALLIWIAGALAMFAWLGRRQALFMTDVQKGKAGPAVVGVFRPRIVTPTDFGARFDESEQRVILAHETIHLARQDARINALVAFLRCICWYNPLVHIGAHAMRIDQELACDATVVERHPKARRLYADALLKAQLVARPLPLGCYWPAGTEHPLMERIEMLKQSAPGQLRRLAGATLLMTLTAAAATAAWAAMPPTTRVVYEDPQQSPAPASAQKIDFSISNEVRISGKVVAANIDASPPTIQVQGREVNDKGPEQLWMLDLTPKGRAPTQTRDLELAKVGAAVSVLAYRVDKSCVSNCTLWARDLTDAARYKPKLQPVSTFGLPDRYDNSQGVMVVNGAILSVVKSGSENIITVRAKSVRRGWLPQQAKPETGDWRIIQYSGSASDTQKSDVFDDQAAVGHDISISGLPEKGVNCATPCTLGFLGSDLIKAPDGRIVSVRAFAPAAVYDAATMAPAANRPNDAPSPVAQPGFNAEDYVVVRGTVVRIEGGNPVKTFWVKAREINRNYEKTEANTDTWRVDRVIPPGGAQPAEVKTGMSIRVDGYVSTSCQPECRIQPMLIDLAQQQASAQPQPTQAQPILYDQQPQPRFSASTNQAPAILKGRITRIDLQDPNSYVWVQGDTIYWSMSDTRAEPTTLLYRVKVGPKSEAPDWATRANAIGAAATLIVYRMQNTPPCAEACDLGGWDVRLQSTSAAPKFVLQGPSCSYPGYGRPGIWGTCPPDAKAATAQPIRFEPQQDAIRPNAVSIAGTVQRIEFGPAASYVWVKAASIIHLRDGSSHKDPTDALYRITVGPKDQAPEWATRPDAVGAEVTASGYETGDVPCGASCTLAASTVRLADDTRRAPNCTPVMWKAPGMWDTCAPIPAGARPAATPLGKSFDTTKPVALRGRVTDRGVVEGQNVLWIEAPQVQAGADKPFTADTHKWGVVMGAAANMSPDVIAMFVGKDVTARGYAAKDSSCKPACMMGGRDVTLPTGEVLFSASSNAPPIFRAAQAAPPADWIPFARYFDAEQPLMLKGKVVGKDVFEGKSRMLLIENASTRSGSATGFTADTNRWRVVLGSVSSTPELMMDALIGREVTVRGYLAKDTSCGPGCLMSGRDITLDDGSRILSGTSNTPASTRPPAGEPEPLKPAPAPLMTAPRQQPAGDPQKTEYREPLPDLIPFERYFDAKAPVLLKGWVRKIETYEGHTALLMEEIETQALDYVRTPARDVTIRWRVVLGRAETTQAAVRDPSLVGKVISVRGYAEKGVKCQTDCMMAGHDIYLGKETLQGWQAPRPEPPRPKPNAPPV